MYLLTYLLTYLTDNKAGSNDYLHYLYLYFYLQGELRLALRPSINCGPMRNPDITKG